MTKKSKTQLISYFKVTTIILFLISVIFSAGKVCKTMEECSYHIKTTISKEDFQHHVNENERQSQELKKEVAKVDIKVEEIDEKVNDIYKFLYLQKDKNAVFITEKKGK